MALKVPPIKNGQPANPIPPGTHQGVLIGVIDIGSQDATDFSGKPEIQHQVILLFELPHERMDDGRPRNVSRKFKLSMHEKSALRKCVHALVGKKLTDAEAMQIELAKLCGANCLIEIAEQPRKDGNGTYSKVEGFSTLMRGMKPAEAEGDHIAYEIEMGEPPAGLPDWIKGVIAESKEHKGAGAAKLPPPPARHVPMDGDEAPF